MMAKKEDEMLTAGKIAELYSIPPAKVKAAIKDLSIEPDAVKGKCCYYSTATAEKIKKAAK